jgi:hypothetical protein
VRHPRIHAVSYSKAFSKGFGKRFLETASGYSAWPQAIQIYFILIMRVSVQDFYQEFFDSQVFHQVIADVCLKLAKLREQI